MTSLVDGALSELISFHDDIRGSGSPCVATFPATTVRPSPLFYGTPHYDDTPLCHANLRK
ncbi:hypothetical protein [Bradyrhizobium aeschynomenes]|uniref:hypothetical protein n=1 Tax=Bradyrhizobium aeschynomenes TaxID=2734909 RepID=UPI0015574E88|nr:hypothetical protein [Bradyrhizobium aeschynomenes]NPV21859.1 hypothetical protein [Bradyrhizobium aeschynomenes]